MTLPRIFSSRFDKILLLANAALVAVVGLLLGERIGAPTAPALRAMTSPALAVDRASHDDFVPKSPMTEMIHRVSPSVVTIGATRRTLQPADDFFAPYFMRETKQLIPYLGSGFVLDREGHIVTNHHVIDGGEQIFVTLADGRQLPAKVLDADQFVDVALLQVDPKDLPPPIVIGDSDDLQIGETAVAMGNPFGPMMQDPRPTVTAGVISAVHRHFQPDQNSGKVYTDMIQTDAAINPGNSGGPLLDANGHLIGMNTFIFSRSGGSQGIGFAIPSNRIMNVVDEIKEHGHLRSIEFGFVGTTVRTPRGTGVVIARVQNKGAADKAGLLPGDLVLTADGRDVSNDRELYLLIASKQVGDKMQLHVWRDGKELDTEYKVVEQKGK